MNLESNEYEIVIIGQVRKDSEGKEYTSAISKSNPSKEARAVGFKPQRFFQCRLRPLADDKNPMKLSGPPRTRTENFFETTHSNFFMFLEKIVKNNLTEQVPDTLMFTGKDEPITIEGDIITVPTGFTYDLQTVDPETRLRKELISNVWDPKQKKFTTQQARSATVTLFVPKAMFSSVDGLVEQAKSSLERYASEPVVKQKPVLVDPGATEEGDQSAEGGDGDSTPIDE